MPQLLLVDGPSGIGKTRLCEQIADEARAAGFRVAATRCWPGGGVPPLWPWPSVLRELVDERRTDFWDPELGSVERFDLFRSIAAATDLATRRRPCLVVIEDVHLADAGTLLLTRFLLQSLPGRRFAVMMSRRTDADPVAGDVAAATLDELARDATVLELTGMTEAEVAELLSSHGVRVGGALVQTLTAATGGNPRLLVRAASRPRAAGAERAGSVRRDALGDALNDPSEATRSIMAAAAILGRATVWEVAALAGTQPAAVLSALDPVAATGAIEIGATGVVAVVHEHVRAATLAAISVPDMLDAHAGAVALFLAAGGREAPVRAAAHAVAAAPRSEHDRRLAIDVCRRASGVMRAGGGYERAAEFLDVALGLSEGLLTGDHLVELQLERADAALACGRLAESRRWYGLAADGGDDVVLAAVAALGVGGVWVYEHRNECDRARVLDQQRVALVRLGDRDPVLSAGLRLRLAAEAAYDGAPLGDVLEALDGLRAVAGGRALAQGLSLAHHALLAPEHLAARRRLADELVTVASGAGDGLLVLFGLMWRTVDRYHAADPAADRSLAELRERTNAVGCRSIRFIVEAVTVMQLVRAGRLDAAEVAAGECFELGIDVGDADAVAYYGAHLLTIRYFQGRDHEIADLAVETASSPTVMQGEYALRAAAVGVVARAGRRQEAATMLHGLTARGLDAIPRSSTWLAALAAIVDAACVLDDARTAAAAYALLAPHADQPVMPSLAVTCLGSTEQWLGMAAATFGDLDRAVEHLERAVRANRLLVNRPAIATSQAELAAVLTRRDGPGDRALAVELLGLAVDGATACSMPVRAEVWAARRAELGGDRAVLRAHLERAEGHWVLDVHGRRTALPALVGVDYVAVLVECPGREVTAIELGGADPVLAGTRHEVLDRATVVAIRERVGAIDDEIARARRRGRADRVAELEAERTRLEDEVRRSLGRGERSRAFVTPGERARTAVTKAIRRAVAAVGAVDPDLGNDLASMLVTGVRCCYRPRPDPPVCWEVHRRGDPHAPGGPTVDRKPLLA